MEVIFDWALPPVSICMKQSVKGLDMNEEQVELIKAYREFLVDAMSGKSNTTPEMVKTMTEAVKLALDYRHQGKQSAYRLSDLIEKDKENVIRLMHSL